MPPNPRQVRWWILALLFTLTVLNFIDRQTLSVLAPVLRETFHMSDTEYGRIVSAFMLGMMAGEFPMGWLMDRRGVRTGLPFAALWWSAGAALHAAAGSVAQFSLFRFWMGTGECANFSGGMKVVSEWFPERERALATGIFNSGAMIGAAIAPPCIVFVTLRFNWRVAFLLPAALGMVWALVWRYSYAPLAARAGVTAAGRAPVEGGRSAAMRAPSNRELLARRQTWALMLCRLLVGPVVQFYWYWMPEYLFHSRGLSLAAIGMFAWVPYLFGDIGNIGGGWASGFLIRRGSGLNAARYATMAFGAACCLLSAAVVSAGSAAMAMAFICLVLFGHTFLSANMFAAISDIMPASAVGRATGLTGIAGGFSGLLFPLLTGYLIDRVSYVPVFFLAAAMPAAGVLALYATGGKIRAMEPPGAVEAAAMS